MKIFSCKGDGEQQLVKNQDFTSVKPPIPAPAILVPAGLWLFLRVALNENSYSETACSSAPGMFVLWGSVVGTSFLQALLWMGPLNSVGAQICITFILKDNVKHAIVSQTTGEYVLQLWKTRIQNITLVTLKTPK